MRRKLSILVVVMGLGLLVNASSPVGAYAASPLSHVAATCTGSSFFGFPPWYACLPRDSQGGPVLSKLEDFWLIAFPLLETAIKIAGYTAVGFVIWGGIKLTKSQGDPGQISGARDTIRDAIIGLVICLSSVAIVQFLASRL